MKDFDTWCKKKNKIENRTIKYPKRREVWWVDLGVNIGSEQDGVGCLYERPVLVLKTFANGTCLIAPMTRSLISNKFSYKVHYRHIESYILLTQLRLISTKRLRRVIWRLEVDKFNVIKRLIRQKNGL